MCMFLDKPNKKHTKLRYAYKVFFKEGSSNQLRFSHYPHHGRAYVYRGIWLRTRGKGFHVFLTREGALTYALSLGDNDLPRMKWHVQLDKSGYTVQRVQIKGEIFGQGYFAAVSWEKGYKGLRIEKMFVPLPRSGR